MGRDKSAHRVGDEVQSAGPFPERSNPPVDEVCELGDWRPPGRIGESEGVEAGGFQRPLHPVHAQFGAADSVQQDDRFAHG
jgi:hypothetical protein